MGRKERKTYMRRRDEILILQRRDARLSVLSVHLLQLLSRILLHRRLDDAHDLLVCVEVGSVGLQTDHFESRGGFERAVDVEVLLVFRLVQVGGHASVGVGLRGEEVGVCS
jgi:hypothetical protein